jgi:ATP-dependent Clp protease ATP-binding subunit ClpA
MNFNNYTIKSQEAIQKATDIASISGQQVIETGHLMKAILQSDENMISFLLKKLGTTKMLLDTKRIQKLPVGSRIYLIRHTLYYKKQKNISKILVMNLSQWSTSFWVFWLEAIILPKS